MGCGGSKTPVRRREETESEPEDYHEDYDWNDPHSDSPSPRSNHSINNNNNSNIANGYHSYNITNGNYNRNINTKKNSHGTQTNSYDGAGSDSGTTRDGFSEPNDKQGYKRRIRNDLIKATAGSNLEVLKKCIERFESNRVEDCGDLTRAKERLQYLQLKRNLRDAIRRSNVSVLERAISDAKSSRYASQLHPQIEAARRKLEHLRELNKYSHDILNMDQATISEIHSYHRPPACVHDVMAASYMLLGHDETTLRDWSYLQSLAGKVGKNSLINQVREFDSSNVDELTADRVKEILGYHDLGEVRIASNGAATFHVWASNIVDMIEKDRGEEDDEEEEYDEEEEEEEEDDDDDRPSGHRQELKNVDKHYPKVQPAPKGAQRSREKRR